MNKGRREGKKNTALKPTILYGLGAFSGPSRFGESVYIYIYRYLYIYIYIRRISGVGASRVDG